MGRPLFFVRKNKKDADNSKKEIIASNDKK